MVKENCKTIQLFPSEEHVNPFTMTAKQMHLDDSAWSLSRTCRYGGHIPIEWYSVAEHSVAVAYYIWRNTSDPLLALIGLHHDDNETWWVDFPSPLKPAFPELVELENYLDKLVSEKYDFPWPWPEIIKKADKYIGHQEMLVFGRRKESPEFGPVDPTVKIEGLTPIVAYNLYISTHNVFDTMRKANARTN